MCRDYKAGISKMTDIYTVFQVLHTSITLILHRIGEKVSLTKYD